MLLSAQQLQASLPARHHMCPPRPNLHLRWRSDVSALHLQTALLPLPFAALLPLSFAVLLPLPLAALLPLPLAALLPLPLAVLFLLPRRQY
jgi:hypothetical protein